MRNSENRKKSKGSKNLTKKESPKKSKSRSKSRSKGRSPELKLLMDTAHANRGIPDDNITRDLVPVTNYPHIEKDLYDGIVFIVGHSQFKGTLCHLPTKEGMRQHTILVANIDNTCFWFSNPSKVDAFVRKRFLHALSYIPENIANFIQTTKNKISKLEATAEKIKTRQDYKKFYESKPKHSVDPREYCQKEWEFFEKDKKSIGRVMLLRRDEKGNPYFKVLYENEMHIGNFTLKKSRLLNMLYNEPYNLRNVLLVDFSCTNTIRLRPRNLVRLRIGKF